MRNPISVIPIILFAIFLLVGCSGQNPINPAYVDDPLTSISILNDDLNSGRQLLGVWDVSIDLSTQTPNCVREQAVPFPDREGAGHMNITTLLPAPTIVLKTWEPSTSIVGLDITISNPFTISGYDVRLIVYTDSLGHKLTNADDWTSLWDVAGGLPINPFKSYAKDQPNRKFGGQSQYTENFKIYLPGGNWQFKIAIDASYPTNCVEPYELTNFIQGIILDQAGSSTELEVTAHSWGNNVNSVKMYCPSITGTTLVSFHQIDSEKWGYTLVNNTTAPSGNYMGYLLATTSKSGSLALYDEVTIKITPFNSGWARTWGGVGDDYGQDIAVDNYGNIYTTGSFASTVDFNPDPILEDIHTASGNGDAFLVKYDKYGNFLWAKTWGGDNTDAEDSGQAVDTDSFGNVYVAGGFQSTVDFGTNGTPDIKASNGLTDIFLCKYTSNGEYQWVRTWGGVGIDYPNRLTVDISDNIILTGYFSSTVDFNPRSGTDNHTSKGGYDVFLSKFNINGDFQWARTWGGNSTYADYGKGVACDSNGNIYVSGYFGGTVDFDPSGGTNTHVSAGWWDAFLSKFDSNSNFQWTNSWGGGYQDEGWECAVDENDDVYVVGNFYYTVDFNPDPVEIEERTAVWESDVFVSKFALDGDFRWVLTWGGISYDYGRVISKNDSGYFWVGGEVPGYDIDFDPGTGSDIKDGGNFISKFNLDGNYLWSKQWTISIIAGDVDLQGNAHLSGVYHGRYTDFNPGAGIWNPSNYSNGNDCYVIKILPNGYWD